VDGYNSYRTFLGKTAEPGPERNADGPNSCTLMHLANISVRVGRRLEVDPATGNSLIGRRRLRAGGQFELRGGEGILVRCHFHIRGELPTPAAGRGERELHK
jgi:hypothetical protein